MLMDSTIKIHTDSPKLPLLFFDLGVLAHGTWEQAKKQTFVATQIAHSLEFKAELLNKKRQGPGLIAESFQLFWPGHEKPTEKKHFRQPVLLFTANLQTLPGSDTDPAADGHEDRQGNRHQIGLWTRSDTHKSFIGLDSNSSTRMLGLQYSV